MKESLHDVLEAFNVWSCNNFCQTSPNLTKKWINLSKYTRRAEQIKDSRSIGY